MAKPRVLFVDAYDSFSNNVISLLETTLNVSATKVHIDERLPVEELHNFAAIIVGPGPGNPYIASDIGCIKDVYKLSDKDILPVLGICLGLQSLTVEFGGEVQQLPYPRHGFTTPINTSNTSFFSGVPKFDVVHYHSLHCVLGHKDGDDVWAASPTCPDIIPLAWDQGHSFSREPPTPEDTRAALGKFNPSNILMGARHVSKPFYGVQFHPESVCSSPGAHQAVANWWKIAQEWNKEHRPNCGLPQSEVAEQSVVAAAGMALPVTSAGASLPFHATTIDIGAITIPAIRDTIRNNNDMAHEAVILDSDMQKPHKLGTHSIVGLVFPNTLKISYVIGNKFATMQKGTKTWQQDLTNYGGDIMKFLKVFMSDKNLSQGSDSPFWGGLMGYIDYEACLETIGVAATPNEKRPNLSFAFIERSVVVNHVKKQIFVQSIGKDDQGWVEATATQLDQLNAAKETKEARSSVPSATTSKTNSPNVGPSSSVSSISSAEETLDASQAATKVVPPVESIYCSKIRDCQTEIRKGNTYELCLTGTTEINVPAGAPAAWQHYLRLRAINPAPFAAYIHMGPVTVLSSSPERFMSWSRPNADKESVCQFRPIKGTVKKHQTNPDGSTHFVTKDAAAEILAKPKEQAENLMIADLIRHDLFGVVGSGNVDAKALMSIEEYETVYQLVTVIEGTLKPPVEASKNGIDVLAASLPPGSMTGAPKKRSCEILTGIEDHIPRSIYSGCIGYMDVGGGGDFSVVIRTAYKWDDETGPQGEKWRIGAGGAITDMSEQLSEWEEMSTKLEAPLRLFGAAL